MLRPLGSRRDFNEEVARAIDATLSEILGEHALGALYRYLKDALKLSTLQWPQSIRQKKAKAIEI